VLPPAPNGRLLVVGVSHHTAPLALRERLALEATAWPTLAPVGMPSLLLRTCNRIEVYAWCYGRTRTGAAKLVKALASAAGLSPAALAPHIVVRSGPEALRHAVRVAAGLDSLVVGEEQILGQLRDALRVARASGSLAGPLVGVLSQALVAGRQVRQGTAYGRHPSLAVAAIEVARHTSVDPSLAGRRAVVVGAGQMARSAAQALLRADAHVTLVNRTPQHAERVARELGGPDRVQAAPLSALSRLLPAASLLVSATAARHPVVDVPTVRAAMQARAEESPPLMVLDLALPRDVEPGVREVPGVVLVDLDDLEQGCPADSAAREAGIAQAEALVVEQVERIQRWLRLRAVAPAIVELRQRGEAIREAELRRVSHRLKDLTPEQRVAVERMAESIVNKLLHAPTIALRKSATRPRRQSSAA
jgi:glutamyl-tRNA reductase